MYYAWHCSPLPDPLLHLAATLGNLLAARILIKHIPLCTMDIDGNTALHYSVFAKDLSMVRLLLDEGADTSFQNRHRDTALHLIILASRPHIDICDNFIYSFEDTPLSLIDRRGDMRTGPSEICGDADTLMDSLPVVRLLLECGANPNVTNDAGHSVLHNVKFAQHSHESMVRLLLGKGADLQLVIQLGLGCALVKGTNC